MAAEWDTEEGEAHMVDMWRNEPLLYTITSKGYSNRDKKYATIHGKRKGGGLFT